MSDKQLPDGIEWPRYDEAMRLDLIARSEKLAGVMSDD